MAAAAVARAAPPTAPALASPLRSSSLVPSVFSVDLVASSLAQRAFLLAVHAVPRGALYEARTVRVSFLSRRNTAQRSAPRRAHAP
jgi:hypothetical protein